MDDTSVDKDALLSADSIVASYDAVNTVLDNVSLQLLDGECLSIIGPSGCGKSTLLKCLAGLLPISSGELRFRGQLYADSSGLLTDPAELRRHMTYVPQEITLFGHYTVGQNLSLVMQHATRASRREKVDRIVSELQLTEQPDQFLSKFPDELSGGQRQRVQLARALLNEPAVLLLDEVTSQIDPVAEEVVVATIRRIRSIKPRLGILLVTHNHQFAHAFADRHSTIFGGAQARSGKS